jgi:predicted ester cyclase
MTDTDVNKALVKRYFTAIEEGDLTAFDEVVSNDYQDHAPGRQPGRGALKAAVQTLRVAFPDMNSTVTHLLAEGDLIAVRNRVTGTQHGPLGELPATGNRVDFTALQLFRVEGKLIIEHWEIFDETTLTQQLSGRGTRRSHPQTSTATRPAS